MNTALKTKTPHILNGINIDDLTALIGTVAQAPEKGATRWRVATSWQGQTHSRSRIQGFDMGGAHVARDFSIDIDEPEELGGANEFANPQEHLLAALNACMMVGYVAQCSLRGISVDRLEIETSGDIDLRGFLGLDERVTNGYDTLNYVVRISGDGTPEQFEEIHQAVMATSPNFHNIANKIELKPTLQIL